MKIFISYRFTGEEPKELTVTLGALESALRAAGHATVCTFWEKEMFQTKQFSPRQILEWALREIDNADCLLSLVKSDDKSEGMLLESGYAIAKGKRRILAIRRGVTTTFMRGIADDVIEFDAIPDLISELTHLK